MIHNRCHCVSGKLILIFHKHNSIYKAKITKSLFTKLKDLITDFKQFQAPTYITSYTVIIINAGFLPVVNAYH